MITVKHLVSELEKENIKLVAGRDHLDRKITYVTSLELTEKTSRIKENGFVLTTFHAFKDINQIVDHLEWLLEIGISALGFHTASIKTLPKEVIDFSNTHSLPMFEIPAETPYYIIFDQYNRLKNEKENEWITEINKLNEKLMESVLLEKDLNSIVKVIGEHINHFVCVLDPYFDLIAYWKKKDQTRNEIKHLIDLIISQNKENVLKVRFTSRETTITVNEASFTNFKVFPLFSKQNFLGYMLINQEGICDKYSEEVINNGIRALSLAAHNKNTILNYQKRKDMKLFESIFHGETTDILASDFYIDLKKVTCIFQAQSYYLESLPSQLQMFSEQLIENESNSTQKGIPSYAKDKAIEIVNIHRRAFESYFDRNILIGAGSDAGSPCTSHKALLDELYTMYDIVPDTRKILKTATINAGKILGRNVGRIQEGYKANLILLRENPLGDLKNLEEIVNVVVHGRFVNL